MEKQVLLGQLRTARSAQIQWRALARALSDGDEIEQTRDSIASARARFDNWYYGSGQKLTSLHAFATITSQVTKAHTLTDTIAEVIGQQLDTSIFLSWFRTPRSQQKLSLASDEFLTASRSLTMALENLEKELQGMSESEVRRLVRNNYNFQRHERAFLVN